MIAIVDYGVGNLFSLKSSFAAIGQQAQVTASAEEILSAQRIILPGVGAFGDAAQKLRALAACVDAYRECRKNAPLPSTENARALTRKLRSRPCPTALFYGEDGRLAALCPVKGDLTGALSELIIRYNTPLVTLAVPEGCRLPESEFARAERAAALLGARLTID